jgi:hypothetical protein
VFWLSGHLFGLVWSCWLWFGSSLVLRQDQPEPSSFPDVSSPLKHSPSILRTSFASTNSSLTAVSLSYLVWKSLIVCSLITFARIALWYQHHSLHHAPAALLDAQLVSVLLQCCASFHCHDLCSNNQRESVCCELIAVCRNGVGWDKKNILKIVGKTRHSHHSVSPHCYDHLILPSNYPMLKSVLMKVKSTVRGIL